MALDQFRKMKEQASAVATRDDVERLMASAIGKEAMASYMLEHWERLQSESDESFDARPGFVFPWTLKGEFKTALQECFPGKRFTFGDIDGSGLSLLEVQKKAMLGSLVEATGPSVEYPTMVVGADITTVRGQFRDVTIGVTAIDCDVNVFRYHRSISLMERIAPGRSGAMIGGSGDNFFVRDVYEGELAGLVVDTMSCSCSLLQMAMLSFEHEGYDLDLPVYYVVPFVEEVLVLDRGEIPGISTRFEKKNGTIKFIADDGNQYEYDWTTYLELVGATVVTHPMLGKRKFWVERYATHPGLFVGWLRTSQEEGTDNLESYKVAWFTGEGLNKQVVRVTRLVDGEWIEEDQLVDKVLYDQIYGMAVSMPPEGFKQEAVLERLRAHSQVQIVFGKVVRLGKVYDPEVLMAIATSIYVSAYVQRYEQTQFFSQESMVFARNFIGETTAGWTEKASKLFLYSMVTYSGVGWWSTLQDAFGSVLRLWTTDKIKRRWFESRPFLNFKEFRLVLDEVSKQTKIMKSSVMNPYLSNLSGFTKRTANLMFKESEEVVPVDVSLVGRCVVDQENNLWLVTPLGSEIPGELRVGTVLLKRDTSMTPLTSELGRAVTVTRFTGMKVSVEFSEVIFGSEYTVLTPYALSEKVFSNSSGVNPKFCGLSDKLWFERNEEKTLIDVQYLHGSGVMVLHSNLLVGFDAVDGITLNGTASVAVVTGGFGTFSVFELPVSGTPGRPWLPGEFESSVNLERFGLRRTVSGTFTFSGSKVTGHYDFEYPILAFTATKLYVRNSSQCTELLGKPVELVAKIGEVTIYEYGEVHGLVPPLLMMERKFEQVLRQYGYVYNEEYSVFSYSESRDLDYLTAFGVSGQDVR